MADETKPLLTSHRGKATSGAISPSRRAPPAPPTAASTSSPEAPPPPPGETSPDSPGSTGGLTVMYATMGFINLCGVFPIITLPRPVIDCGWLGIPLVLFSICLLIYTSILLGQSWIIAEEMDPSIKTKNRSPYAALATKAFGAKWGKAVSVLLDINIFGSGVPNLIVASQNLQLFVLNILPASMQISYCIWLVILGVLLCPVMCLGGPKDMKWVSSISVGVVMGIAMLTGMCMLIDPTVPFSAGIPSPSFEAIAIAYGILSFQFTLHPMVLTMQMDMNEKKEVRKAVALGYLVIGGLFFLILLIAMIKYGTFIQYNVLQGLPGSVLLYIDALLVTLQICLSMVLGGSALFQDVEDKLGIPKEFNWKRCVVRTCIVMSAVLIAELIPRFELLMGLIGGALCSPLVFFLPPLIYSRLKKLQAGDTTNPLVPSQGAPPRAEPSSPPASVETGGAAPATAPPPAPQREGYIPKFVEMIKNAARNAEETFSGKSMSATEQYVVIAIIVFGIAATISATFFSIRNSILYAQSFSSACL